MNTGTVIARGGLNLRKSPKTGRVIKTLRRGTGVEIVAEERWLLVRTRAGDEGYVLGDFVELEPQTAITPPEEVPVEDEPALTPVCDIRRYQHERFIGNELRADVEFFPLLDVLAGMAAECGLRIYVTSSTREPKRAVSGAIVPPASRSNHLVGHAIDMNLQSASGFFNSKKLKRATLGRQPREVRDFVGMVRDHEILRWGGDFSPEDPVHIDDNLNHREPDLWDAKLAART